MEDVKAPEGFTQEQFIEIKNMLMQIVAEIAEPPDDLVDVPEFMRLAECKKDFAYETFKNKELVRLGILLKITPLNKQGGWRIHWQKYLKWAKKNAEMALNA